MLFVAGLVLLLLGLLSGVILLMAPLGIAGASAGLALWILFPVFTIGGYLLAALPARTPALVMLTRGSGIALMALALAAAMALVLQAGAIVPANGSSLALWYVLAVGLVLGSTGVATFRSGTPDAI